MRLVHISDTHSQHSNLVIPECDVLIHSGDIGGRTNLTELTEFLIWFEKQPAKKRIWIAGNHDIILDKKWSQKLKNQGNTYEWMIAYQAYQDAMKLIENFDVKYLCDTEYVWEGIKFYGSPYSPSFYREHWVFNADRGKEIQKIWAKIPTDVNVLITHGPPHGVLDVVEDKYLQAGQEPHKGCEDLMNVITKRLLNLKLVCYGHIHDNVGIVLHHITTNRRALFSNGAVLTNHYKQLIVNPMIIQI